MATENMVKAGRAGLTFGGDWDETVEYNRLVGVRYDNKLFFSKKPVPIGTIPEDGEYWFLAYEGLTDEQWEALLNGTQQVGDSARLGGKDASEYALGNGVTLLTAFPNGITSNSTMQELLNALRNGTILHVRADSPLVPQNYSTLTVFKYGTNYVLAFAKSQLSNILYYGSIGSNSSWSGWSRPALNTDLANYLPLSAKPSGTYTGNGSATERFIEANSSFPYYIISSAKGISIVTVDGCFGHDGSSAVKNSSAYASGTGFKLFSSSPLLNENGVLYKYHAI